MASGESSDEEDTIIEEERLQGETDHKRELDELKVFSFFIMKKLTEYLSN